ncbi:MAG: hypothetical protein AAF441_12145 [Pseudomonadota bacterium]
MACLAWLDGYRSSGTSRADLRLEPHLLRVIERPPAFGEAGFRAVNNGPIWQTPNGCPLPGPVYGQPGLWLASGFAIGFGTGGGSAEQLAGWMVNGEPEYDLPIVYPSCYSGDLTKEHCLAMIHETCPNGYLRPD